MSKSVNHSLLITPKSKRNQLFLTLFGALLLLISLITCAFLWSSFKLQMMILLFASCIVLLTGFSKLIQPQTSFRFTSETLSFIHQWGQWQLHWQDIIRFGIITCEVNTKRVQLPYIGIKLANLNVLAKTVSPRLANKLLHEQKELISLALKAQLLDMPEGIINFEEITVGDTIYKGPIAAWLHRSNVLDKAYGYHLFLPQDTFDREIDEFLRLLKQLKEHHVRETE